MRSVLIFIIIYLFSISIADNNNGWYLAQQTSDSFQPSGREFPHVFKKNSTHAILYGGFFEQIAYNMQPPSSYYNDIYILDTTNKNALKWTKVENLGSIAPSPRSIDCAAYYPNQNALYIYGGTSYSSEFQNFIFYEDSWVFRFSTQTWQQLDTEVPAGPRAGMGCDYVNGNVIVTHGSHGTDLVFYDDTWSWNLVTNTWTKLTTSQTRPSGRFEFEFSRIPDSEDFLLANGQISTSPAFSNYLTDVWVLKSCNWEWQQLSISGVPSKVINVAGYALTNSKFLLMAGGDEDLAHLTLADTCKSPLDCVIRANPTDKNYWLRLKLNPQDQRGDWEDAAFDHSFPPVRKPSILIMEPYLYLIGGTGWDGQYGTGVRYNTNVYALQLNQGKYWN